jgi:5-methyltetrahydrofolate--homocysteine methyltransferase
MEAIIQNIFDAVVNGDNNAIQEHINQSLESEKTAEEILNKGLIPAMAEVGKRFEAGEYFVPEMLISARAMKSGMAILKPLLVKSNVKAIGKVLIGTVKGDLHDIGKNLVSLMLEGAGFEVIDAGSDIAPEKFVELINQHHPDLVGMSALLTTTMTSMKNTIIALEQSGVRKQVKILIGGAPVTENYSKQIGADGYAEDASKAVAVAKLLMDLP